MRALDKSLKQRLVGAAILVALVVLLVPELLRGKGVVGQAPSAMPPRAAESASTMDAGSAPMRSVTIDVSDSAADAPATADGPVPQASAPASAASSVSVVAPTPPVETAPPKPADAPAAVATPMAPPAAASLPKPAPKGPWVVQLGSFALRVSAERLVRELKAAGYPAYVSPVTRGARELFRVRVGPMADRAAASAYYKALQEAGKDAAIVPNR